MAFLFCLFFVGKMDLRDGHVIVVDRPTAAGVLMLRRVLDLAGLELRHRHRLVPVIKIQVMLLRLMLLPVLFQPADTAAIAARVSLRGSPPHSTALAQIRLMNRVMARLFKKSANRLPTSGTIRYALMEGAYFSQTTCMLAMALGVAPIPKPQVPDTSTAAS